MEINSIRHRWTEKVGFSLNRQNGTQDFVLLHFITPVELFFYGGTCEAGSGSLIVFSPFEPHGFISHGPLTHDWMHITGDVREKMAHYGLKPKFLYKVTNNSAISEMIAFLETEYFAGRKYWADLSEIGLQELFIRIAHNISGEKAQIRVRDETAERLRDIRVSMLAAPQIPWTIQMISEALNISQSHLYSVYHSMFGISPIRDRTLMRIDKAKHLLIQGHSISETAELTGYTNVYHFIRQFHQLVGATPKKFSE